MAEYDLGQVKAAAQNLDIEYRGRKVSRDIANLGYDLSDVSKCLSALTPSNFRKLTLTAIDLQMMSISVDTKRMRNKKWSMNFI